MNTKIKLTTACDTSTKAQNKLQHAVHHVQQKNLGTLKCCDFSTRDPLAVSCWHFAASQIKTF
jgi:hypothetical protein